MSNDWKKDLANAASSIKDAQRKVRANNLGVNVKRSPAQWAALVDMEDRATLKEVAGILRLYELGRFAPGEAIKAIQDLI